MVRFYPIIEPRDVFDRHEAVARLLDSGITLIQIRGDDPRAVEKAAVAIVAHCDSRRVSLIINDHVDIAKGLGCGLHVGQTDMELGAARARLGSDAIIGISTHRRDEWSFVREASYVSVGPVFPTASKKNPSPVVGVEFIGDARRALDENGGRNIPIVAIGGLTRARVFDCLRAGASYIAAIGCLRAADGSLREDAAEIVEDFRDVNEAALELPRLLP